MSAKAIFTRTGFEAFALSLPSATLVRQWRDDSVAKVGGKIFALLDDDPGEVWLKCSPMSFDMLRELPGIRPAPYFARASWVAIGHDAPLTEPDIKAYITEAHRLIAMRLTRKLQGQLGLKALTAPRPETL